MYGQGDEKKPKSPQKPNKEGLFAMFFSSSLTLHIKLLSMLLSFLVIVSLVYHQHNLRKGHRKMILKNLLFRVHDKFFSSA